MSINLRVYDSSVRKSAHVIADRVLLPPATRKLDRNVHQVRPDAPISRDNNNIGSRGSVAVTRTRSRRVGAAGGGCSPWIMARVTLASSLTLVSLRLRSGATRYRKEEDSAREKNASHLARTLLHLQLRRTATMADDERATLPHWICEREVNLPRTQQ